MNLTYNGLDYWQETREKHIKNSVKNRELKEKSKKELKEKKK